MHMEQPPAFKGNHELPCKSPVGVHSQKVEAKTIAQRFRPRAVEPAPDEEIAGRRCVAQAWPERALHDEAAAPTRAHELAVDHRRLQHELVRGHVVAVVGGGFFAAKSNGGFTIIQEGGDPATKVLP